jgi:NhaP-type Na+/H+ or K+/H+ antiporter
MKRGLQMVALILAFGVVLLIAVSVSGLAARTVLSTSLLFLVAGALLGPGGLGVTSVKPGDHIAKELPTIALFIVVFAGGQRASWQALTENWPLPGRALGLGMPLTMVGIAVPTHLITELHWSTSFLFGAILAPTDPVFAAALVNREDIPQRLRRLLNVESGLNDGLTLPFVLIALNIAQHQEIKPLVLGSQLAGGLLVGFALAAAVALLWRLPILGPAPRLQALGPVAIAVVLYAITHLTHANPYLDANPYLAAFAAGSTLATFDEETAEMFKPFGESMSELSKFAALLVFGALITPTRLLQAGWQGWLLAVIAIVVVRIGVMMLSLLRSRLTIQERLTAAWFGPKGFASVIYALLVLDSPLPEGDRVLTLVAVAIALSITLHSSSDVPVAKRLKVEPPGSLPRGDEK